jgi:hypothetical protein
MGEDDPLSDEREAATLRFLDAARLESESGVQARRSFTDDQRRNLLQLGLFAEQVTRLESNTLQSIAWRMVRPPHMQDVREKLVDLTKALNRVERLYKRLSTTATAASAEVRSRLYMAQEALGFNPLMPEERDKLDDSLESATNIVRRALQDLPQVPRSTRRNSVQFVRLILEALHLGHVEHFRCSGYGDTPREPEHMPQFLIEVARKERPFPQVAEIVAEASGGWSADDAIRAYLRWEVAPQ